MCKKKKVCIMHVYKVVVFIAKASWKIFSVDTLDFIGHLLTVRHYVKLFK